jgi:hypothetical protein
MKNKKTIFLIGGAIFLAIIVIYSLKSPQAADNGVSAVGVQDIPGASAGSGPAESDEIVKILSMLSKVSLKTDFFGDQLFLSLEDLSVLPAEGEMGRSNPFAAYSN